MMRKLTRTFKDNICAIQKPAISKENQMFTDPMLQIAKDHARDLRRKARRDALANYPDRERRPRILRYWANR